ncbi:hypothetical protein PRUPE_2G001100 [Prunus persica]|nr:hypothetical protein PRUPE_2G001100 [Prunus persica]
MTACVGIRWPLFEHFGPILGGFEVWVYMPSSRTASPKNELLGISQGKSCTQLVSLRRTNLRLTITQCVLAGLCRH